MKISYSLNGIILILFCCCCSQTLLSLDLQPGQNFAYEWVDYTKTPVYKQIKKHPENYTYLEQIDIYRIQYLSEGLKITGLMVAPKAEGKFPVVVFNRGGNRDYGQLLISSATDILAPIAAQGYVVVASNYRGNSGSEGVEEFGGSDVLDVVNLAKTCSVFEKADTSKIGLLGISRGGMMNYLIMRKMHEYNLTIRCAVTIGGITDLSKTIEFHPEIGTVCQEIIPNYTANKLVELQKRSAIYWCAELPSTCPLLILHSIDDAAVTYQQIPPFADSLDKYNKPYQLIAYKNDNHGIMHHKIQVQEKIELWFSSYLMHDENFSIETKRLEVE